MALSDLDHPRLLAIHEAESDTMQACIPRLCTANDDALWVQFIVALEADTEFAYIADVARKWRSAGMPLDMFLKEMIASFEACEQSDKLDEVFDLSEVDGWDIEPEAIEAALGRIKEGASADDAYNYAKSISRRGKDSKLH